MPRNNANVDEQVVEMRIDNRQFVSGAEKTISVLDKLKQALSFKNAADDFDSIQKSANNIDLSGMAADVEAISQRFSTMGLIGMGVIKNLTDSVTNFVTNTVKGLTIDPISQGWGKYEDIARSTSTIMAATRMEEIPERYGTQLEYVKDMLGEVSWYADETSATLTDMTNTIGKFTSSGMKLENAAAAAMGVYNVAYAAGATNAEAGRALYNFAQAVSVGSVKLMDWRSIENANMATIDFKNTILETAADMGTLTASVDKTGNVVYKTMKGTEVSAKNFSDALSEGWFTSSVLEKVLTDYGEYSRRLSAVMDKNSFSLSGISTSEVMGYFDGVTEAIERGIPKEEALKALQEELAGVMDKDLLPSLDALDQAYLELSDEELAKSKAAFLMGQEYKTFSDVIDATRDAVSTGWMKTFELVIGDAEQAKDVWSAVGDEFYDIFAGGAAWRNAVLSLWNDPNQERGLGKNLVSGRDSLLNAIKELYLGIRTYIDPIVEAFQKVFRLGDTTQTKNIAQKLLDLTYRFEEWSKKVALSDKATEGMRNAFTKLFELLKKGLGILKPVFKVIGTGISLIKQFVEVFFESFTEDGFDFTYFKEGIGGLFETIIEKCGAAWEAVKTFYNSLKANPTVNSILSWIETAFGSIWGFVNKIVGGIGDLKVELPSVEGASEKISGFWQKMWDRIKNIHIDTDKLKESFGKLGEIIGTVYNGLVGDPEEFKAKLTQMLTNAIQAAKDALSNITLSDVFEGAKSGTLLYMALQFSQFVTSFKKATDEFKSIPEAITGTFKHLSKAIDTYGAQYKANNLLKMAEAIALVAAAMWILSKIPERDFASVTVALAFFMIILSKIANNLSKMGSQFSNNKYTAFVRVMPDFAGSLIAIAILLGVAAAALFALAKLSWDDIWKGLDAMALVLLASVIALSALSKNLDKDVDTKALGKLVSIALVISAAGKAMSRLKGMSWGQILAAAAALGGVIIAVTWGLSMLQDSNVSSGVGVMLGLMSVLVVIYAIMPLLFALTAYIQKNNIDALLGAILVLVVIAGAAVGLTALLAKVGSSKGALKGAGALALIGAAFVLFAASLAISAPAILAIMAGLVGILELIGTITDAKLDQSLKVLGVLGLLLLVIGTGAALLGAGMLSAGAGFAAFGAGAILVAGALGILTLVLAPLAEAIVDFCNTLAENGEVVVKIVSVVIAGVLAALLASKLKIGLTTIAIILTVIAVIHEYGPMILEVLGVILEDVLNFLLTLIPMFYKFLVIAVIMIIDEAANALREKYQALESAIENLISVIIETAAKVFFQLLGDLIGSFVQWISDRIGPVGKWLAERLGVEVDEVGRAVADGFGSWGDSIGDATYKAFGGAEREASSGAASLIDAFNKEFASGETDVMSTLTGTIANINKQINPQAEASGKDTGNSYLSGLTGAFGKGSGLEDISDAVLGSLDQTEGSKTLGGNSGVGFANGLTEKMGDNEQAGALIAWAQQNGYIGAMDIHSPSRVAYRLSGLFSQGLINGMADSESDVADSSRDLAVKMAESIENALTTISAIADEDFSINPTITPVVDMTNVDAAAGSVSDMFASTSMSSASKIGRTMADLDRLAASMTKVTEAKNNVSQDHYEVNIYTQPDMDEEAIADAVVYRISNGVVRKGAALG